MPYLLDTDIYIYLKQGNKNVLAHLNEAGEENIFFSSISIAELYYGAFKSKRQRANLREVERDLEKLQKVNFNHQAARIFGRLKADLVERGHPLSDRNLAIASIAIEHQYALVTHNAKHFTPLDELIVEDWSEG